MRRIRLVPLLFAVFAVLLSEATLAGKSTEGARNVAILITEGELLPLTEN